jgi:hypothetical protein
MNEQDQDFKVPHGPAKEAHSGPHSHNGRGPVHHLHHRQPGGGPNLQDLGVSVLYNLHGQMNNHRRQGHFTAPAPRDNSGSLANGIHGNQFPHNNNQGGDSSNETGRHIQQHQDVQKGFKKANNSDGSADCILPTFGIGV